MLVTVIMPTYNAAKCVVETINSVIAQTYSDIEFIVVDDGSRDDTVALVRAKLARDFKHSWQIIELGSNRGASAARNVGLRAARGSWVQFLDGDDLLAPAKLTLEVEQCAKAGADVSAVYSPFIHCHIDNGKIGWRGPFIDPDIEGRLPIMHLIAGFRPLNAAGLARRAVLEQIGGFDELLRFWECEELNVRLAKAGRCMRVRSSEPLYLWRLHSNQTYIGGNDARYQSGPVALGWMAQVLKAADGMTVSDLGLMDAERAALLDECTFWGRLVYGHDRAAFRTFAVQARQLEPLFRPTNPVYMKLAARYVGYEASERLGKMVRAPKTWLRKRLHGMRPRRQKGLFDWN